MVRNKVKISKWKHLFFLSHLQRLYCFLCRYDKRKFKAGVMALAAISAIRSGAAATKAATKLKEGVAKGEGVGVE